MCWHLGILNLKRMLMISRGSSNKCPMSTSYLIQRNKAIIPFSFSNLGCNQFKLDKYDPAEIERLKNTLKREAPNVTLLPIYKEGTMTHVLPFHRPYTLIQPNSTIAHIYNPTKLSSNENVQQSPILYHNSRVHLSRISILLSSCI